MASAPDLSPAAPADLGPDFSGDNGMVSTTYPAPHPAPPQVINGFGPVMAHPTIVPIFFSNDDMTTRASLEDFAAKIGATPYWTAVGTEYGVGAATSATPIELTETATGTIPDSQIQTWLAGKLNANDPLFPAANGNTVYLIFYPTGVTITLPGGGFGGGGTSASCTTFGGYHDQTNLDAAHGNATVTYAVIPRCPGEGSMTVLDMATSAASHELIEAATDPQPMSSPAYAQPDDDHLYWLFALGGGEVGDMCAQDASSFTKFPGFDYMVQRSWSNAAAMAGHDPCVPALANEVYFAAVPELNDTVTLGGMFTMKGVSIPVGQTKTVDLDLFSDGPTNGPFTVSVKDLSSLMGGTTSSFNFTLDRTQGQNGEKLHLTIDSLSSTQYGAGVFVVISKLGNARHMWFGLVGQ